LRITKERKSKEERAEELGHNLNRPAGALRTRNTIGRALGGPLMITTDGRLERC
jgi:hypothetical protein